MYALEGGRHDQIHLSFSCPASGELVLHMDRDGRCCTATDLQVELWTGAYRGGTLPCPNHQYVHMPKVRVKEP
jgi:hypothetical protein